MVRSVVRLDAGVLMSELDKWQRPWGYLDRLCAVAVIVNVLCIGFLVATDAPGWLIALPAAYFSFFAGVTLMRLFMRAAS